MTETGIQGRSLTLNLRRAYVPVFALALLWLLLASPARAGDITMTDADIASFAGLMGHVEDTRGQGRGTVERTISLGALGRTGGIEIGSTDASATFVFDLPQHAMPEAQVYASFQLDQTLRATQVGRVAFRAVPDSTEGGEAAATLMGRVRSDTLALTLPVTQNGETGFAFAYATNAVCVTTDERAPLFALRPESTFSYRVDLGAIATVADAARVLGDAVTITLSGRELTEDQFKAAFDLGRALEAQGRRVSFNRLPGPLVFDETTSIAAINDAVEAMLAHREGELVSRALREGRADAVIAFSALAASGAMELELGLGDIVIASRDELARLSTIRSQIANALGASNRTLRSAFEGQVLNLEHGEGLAIFRAGHRPVIALVDVVASQDLIALFGGVDASRAQSDLLPIGALSAQTDLNQAGVRSEWVMPFSFADLPAGTLPTHFDLSLVPGIAADVTSQLAHVFLNGQLLRTVRLNGLGDAQSTTMRLPANLMSRQNSLRVLLQRDATPDGCEGKDEGAIAQLLPASGIRLAQGSHRPEEFYQLAPFFGAGLDIAMRQTDLGNPVAALKGLRALTRTILPVSAASSFHFLPEGMRFAPRGAFILYGVAPAALEVAPMRLDRGAVDVTDRSGDLLLSLADLPDAAVVQIVTAFDQTGLWVSRPLRLEGNIANQLEFDHGNLAIVDARGVALWVNTSAPRGLLIDYVETHFIADILGEYRMYILGGVWILLTLLLIRLVVGARNKMGRG